MQHRDGRPFHVGIIMDGNGRWAAAQGLSRLNGHAHGARRVTDIVNTCPSLGVSHLTLYAFSTENWRRPLTEIEGLMRIFGQYIRRKMVDLKAHGVRVRFIGLRDRVPPKLRRLMDLLEAVTRDGSGLQLTIAIDYGGRDDLARALRGLCLEVAGGRLSPSAIGEHTIDRALDTHGLPDPDLIIRTSGECRLSNFLLWQAVYAEYDFPATAWPDFTVERFTGSVEDYRRRSRRFGAVDDIPRTAAGS